MPMLQEQLLCIQPQVAHLKQNFENLSRLIRCGRKLTKLCTAPYKAAISFLGTISNWCNYQFQNFNFLNSILKSMLFSYESFFHYFFGNFNIYYKLQKLRTAMLQAVPSFVIFPRCCFQTLTCSAGTPDGQKFYLETIRNSKNLLRPL